MPDQEIEPKVLILSDKDDSMTDALLRLLGEKGIKMLIPLEVAEQIDTARKNGNGVKYGISKVGKFPLRSGYDRSGKEESVIEIAIDYGG